MKERLNQRLKQRPTQAALDCGKVPRQCSVIANFRNSQLMTMQAAFYTRKGPAAEVLQVGELDVPEPSVGEVRVRIKVSAVNPSDTKNRGGHR
ncbi:MAG: hypothetical protein EBX71_08620, partial [Betaproteobacteria bacterium]|nr:hypothetical protein [Betaproteobacteria bacterium]